jgi:YHS domain-containing protein
MRARSVRRFRQRPVPPARPCYLSGSGAPSGGITSSPFSRIASARSNSGRAAAGSPWSRSRTARLWRLFAVSGCSGPSTFSRIASARSNSGRAAARSPCPAAGRQGWRLFAVDPVCGMTVDPAKTPHRHTHEGHEYFFCSGGCRGKFIADPAKYLRKDAAEAAPATPPGTIYTCPMHPQIRQVGPGSCPICGMALEPMSVTAEAAPNEELIDMTRRFWIGAVLAVPLVLLEMGAHFPGLNLHHYIWPQTSVWVQFLLATPVVLWAGWPFFVRGWASVRNCSLNMFSLIALGVGAA